MPDLIVDVKGLLKTYTDDAGTFEVLRGISLQIERGQIVGLLGVSGAGKTTLLQILGGLDSFNSGDVKVCGKNPGTMSPMELAEFRNRHIGFVFQFHHLLPDFTAIENVIIPGLILRKPRAECIKKANNLLEIFGLEKRKGHFPAELSGGERQRVALARALFNDPWLVLADEPTGNLDRGNGELLLELFKKANRELNQTFLIATHNNQLTTDMHRVITLDDGRIVQTRG